MKITKEILQNCKEAIEYFKSNPDKSHYLVMRNQDEKYVEYMIEKGNWFYGQNDYVYWDGGGIYGFNFDDSILDLFK